MRRPGQQLHPALRLPGPDRAERDQPGRLPVPHRQRPRRRRIGVAGVDQLPGYFLRHRGYALYVERNDGSALFGGDASFHRRTGLSASAGLSLESYNFPGGTCATGTDCSTWKR
ncbi:AbfB domain-containing protein [Micromonospora sp. M12]